MDYIDIGLILFLTNCLGVGLFFLIRYLVNKPYNVFINNHSLSIKNLKRINNDYRILNYSDTYLSHEYDNENFYNNISNVDYLIYQLQFIQRDVIQNIKIEKENLSRFDHYQKLVRKTCNLGQFDCDMGKLKKDKLLRFEEKRFNNLLHKRPMYYSITVELYRTDIKGKILEMKRDRFSSSEIQNYINQLNNRRGSYYLNRDIWLSISRVERGKVSNKMRFAIYKRDGYRCKRCGRRDNGTNLEIDHIIPISKGGKSDYYNLQTLCRRCNKEKGDSIEYYDTKLY